MPYYEVRAADLEDGEKIRAWAQGSVAAAARQDKGKKT